MTREEFLQRRYAEDRVEEAAREKKRASLGEGTRAGALPGAASGAAAYNRLTGTSPMLSNDVGASRGPRGLAAGSDILAYQAQQERQAQQRARDMAAEELKRAITPRSGGVVHDGSYGGKLRTQGSSWQPEEAVAAPSPFLGRLSTGSDIMAQERERELAGLEALKRAAEEAAGLYEQAEAERRDSIMPIVSDLGAYTARQESERRLGELAAAKRNAEREYKDRARELGELPGLGERALKTLSGAGKQYLGSTWDAAGALMPNGTAMGQVYSEQLESLYGERQRTEEWLKSPEDEDERRQLENRLASLNEQIAVYEASARANAGVSAAARDAAAEITRSGAADIERAKTGASAGGRLLVDAGAAGAQMLGDIAIGAATGLGNMAPMMARSFGGGTQEAREKGYTQKQQIALGVSSAATEYLSEKLFGGNPVYDADAGLVSRLAGKLSHNDRLLEMLSSRPAETVYEGLEEIVSDLLNPVAEQIIAGRHDELTAEELITDGIVGMMLGGVGQGANAIGLPGTQKAGERAAGRFFTDMGGEAVSAVISEGMDSAPGTQSRTLAEQLKARLDAGEKISPAQLGRLYRANVEAIDAETAAGTAETANAQTEGHAYDGDLHGGVDTADMSAAQAAGNVKGDAGAENAVQAGRATTILNPYEGEKPQYTAPQNRVTPSIEGKSLADAETRISEARAREQNDGRSFRKNLTNLYEQIFSSQGGSRGIAVNGASMDGRAYVVTLNKGAIGKIISDKNISPQKLAVLDAIDDVIENGEYVGSGKYVQKGGKQKDTIRFDYFETPVVIDGQAYTVTFDVEVFPSTNNYRTHKVINEMDIVSNSLTDTGTHLPQGLSGQRPFTGDSIALNAEDVNAGAENKTDAPAAIKTGVPAQSGITGTAETSAPKIAQRSGGVKSGEKKDDGRLGPVGRKTARKFYNGGPADSYYAEFTAYYQAGLTGAGPETVRSSYAGTLNSAQRQAAYLAGQTDAQNRAGADTRSDSRSKAEPGAEKSGGTAAAENRGASPTDTRESGRRLNVDEETVRQAVRLSEATGRRIVFYEGAAGENGYYGGGTIHVNANSARPSAQIIAHELTHSIEGGEGYAGLSELVLRRIERQGGDLEALRREKAELYGRAGHPLESAAAVDAEIVAEYVERSLLTDERSILALAREDRTLAQRILGWLDRLLAKLGNGAAQERVFVRQAAELYRGALEQTAGEARPETDTARRGDDYLAQLGDRYSAGEISEAEYDRLFDEYYKGGSETAYSIERTTDNRPFVEVERDILAGVPKSQWVSVVKENLKKKFPDGITVGNNEIKINQQSRNEMTYSGYMQWLSSNNPAVHSDKLRATDNAGEMVRAATDWVNEGLNHPRRDSIADFARGSVLLRIGERDYSADVVVGTRKNGGMILYDVLNLQPASFTKKETDAVNTKNPSPEADSSTAPLSADTVAQSGGAVKGQGGKNPTGGARYSISETRDGKKYVRADRQVIFGDNPKSWGEQVEDYINGKIRRGQDVRLIAEDGETLVLTAETAGKAKHAYRADGSPMTKSQYLTKINAEAHIDELAQVSRRTGARADEQARHGDFASGGWQYRTTYFQDFDGKYYKLTLSVAQGRDGNVVYNIGRIEERSSFLPENHGSSAEGGALGEKKASSAATVAQSGGAVNSQGGKNPSGGVRYSISETRDGRSVAVVDSDILSGIDTGTWTSEKKAQAKAAAKKALLAFKDGVEVNGIRYKVNKTTRNEYTYSENTKWMQRNQPEVFADKLRAASNVDDVITATTGWANDGGLKHPRRDSFVDFTHGNVLIQAGNNRYEAETVVGITAGGEYVLYDVIDMKPASFKINEEFPRTAAGKTAISDIGGNSSSGSIAQSGGAVKGQGGKNPTGGARYSISETRDGIEAYETSEEIRRMPYRQRMEAFMDIMRSEYRGRTAKFVGANGEVYYAKFDGADLRKNIYGDKKSSPRGWRAKINTGADGNIFELIENARHSGSSAEQGKHTAAHRGLTGWEYFVKTVQIDGKMYDLLANVRKKPEGEYVYSIQLGESKNEASALPRQYQNGTAKAENRPVRVPTDASEATIRESGGDVKGQGGKNPSGGARYSISEDYAQEIDAWDRAGRPEGNTFVLGATGEVMQGLGAMEQDIYLHGDKAKAILDKHPEMTLGEIKRIPEILDDPVLVLKSKGENIGNRTNTRLVVFGSIKAQNGQPVMSVLDLRPIEGRMAVNDMQKVSSAYTRNNAANYIEGCEVLHADEKRTIPLLRSVGLHVGPTDLLRHGSVGSISYSGQNVKLSGVPFSEVVGTSEAYEGRRYSVDESGAAERCAEAVERLPAKARGYLDRAERKLTRKISEALSVPAAAQRTYLKDIAREISEQYLSDGRISDETINSLFERAYDRSGTARETRSAQDARDFKEWARRDFDSAIGDMLGELRTVRRWTQERQAKREAPAIESLEQVEQAYALLKDARRQSEKATAKNLLTEHDEALVSALLAGRMELRHLDPKTDNVRGVTEVYKARQEYERLAGQLRQWNASRRAQLREQADAHLKNANGWKDKKAGILYSRETMERNIRDIVKDSAEAESIIREYFTPVHEAQAESTRLKNRMRERVRALGLSTKETAAMKKAGKVSEAHAVQLLGEATDNIRSLEKSTRRMAQRDGKTLEEWRSVVRELWAQNPQLDRGKIEGAVEEFRRIYDELFRSMNEARIRNGYEPVNYRSGYFPHFQPGEGDGIMGLFGRALGIRTDVTALPTSINGLTHTFRPGIQWFGSAQERLGFNTVYDAVEGFDRYIEGVADVIYQTDNIQRLRALAQQIRYRTGDEGLRRQIDEIRADAGLSEEDRQSRIDRIHENGRFTLSNFVVELEEYTNLLANKKSGFDRGTERLLGRRIYNTVKGLEGRVAANMVAVNPGSWLTNFIPLTQGGAALGRFDLLSGMWDTLRAYISDDGFAGRSAFLTNRRGSDPLVRGWTEKASAALGAPMEIIDRFTADSLVRGRYRQNIRRGLSEAEAMREADGFVSGVMADRSKGSMPTFFESRNPAAKLVTQFQLEVNNQIGFYFKDLPRELRDRGALVITRALLRLLLGSWLFNEVYEFFVGRRPAVDPLGMLNDAAGDLTGWELPNVVEMAVGAVRGERPELRTEKTGAYTAAKNLAGDAAEQLPFIGGLLGGGRLPINSALPNAGKLVRAIAGEGWSAEKRRAEAAKALSGPASYLLPPFGGGQVKKAYQGIKAAAEGGSYTVDAEGRDILQFPVFGGGGWETAKNAVQAAIFGKTSLSEGQEWVSSGFDSLSARETAAYQAMLGAGVRDRDAYGLIEQLAQYDHKADKFDILMGSGISDEGKGAAYYSLLAGESEREALDILGEAAAQAAADRVSRYGEISGELEALESFAGLEVEAREKALLNAWRLSEALALEEGSEGRYEPASGWMQWAAGGGDAGVSEAEAILFKAAYDMSSSDTDPETGKTVSGSKKKNTLELAGELLPGLSDTELEYLMSGFWKS